MLFAEICTLLSRLEDIETRDPPILQSAEKYARIKDVTRSWFRSHRRAINELSVEHSVALISALLPERRKDRVYDLQAARLCRVLGRCLGLGIGRTNDLQGYKQPSRGDLATCLERVLAAAYARALPPASLSDVDDMLQTLASSSRFSDPSITKLPPGSSEVRDQFLGNIFKRMSPNEGKWLVRMILKDLSPVRTNEALVLSSFHFLLPDLLQFQNQFAAAITLLKGPLQGYPENPDSRSERLLRKGARESLRPTVGIKVGRPEFVKARSVDHCLNMLGGQKWVLERKYDGEYCEIHIDLNKSPDSAECITIFSKSGKNSTADRSGICQTLVQCLHLRTPECKFKHRAILVGELVDYSDGEQRVLPFEQIRRHVSRSGSFIGTDLDSQPKIDEHLAIVFFDVLLLDDEVVMTRPIEERRNWLREVYTKIGGRAMSSEWKIVDFSDAGRGKKALVNQFAASIAESCEGLVLKPCGVPYVTLGSESDGRMQRYIKLKKDYIADLGDEGDFAVLGASYNAQQALRSGVANVKWTDFHLGCLLNKADVLRFDARPRYKLVGTIQQEACIPKPVLQAANDIGRFCAKAYNEHRAPVNFDLDAGATAKIDVMFDRPFVFEVLGSGFEKPSNCNFFMLRHARVKKLHQDRTWRDCLSFQELQEQAAATRAAPVDSESQETRRWIEKLEKKCKKKNERLRNATPRSTTTATPSTTKTSASRVSSRVKSKASPARPTPAHTATSRSASELEGTTLVGSTSPARKRQRGDTDTPCPPAKKHCSKAITSKTDKRPGASDGQDTLSKSVAPLSGHHEYRTSTDLQRDGESKHDCQGSKLQWDLAENLEAVPTAPSPSSVPRALSRYA